MTRSIVLLIGLLYLSITTNAQNFPKREMRAAWLSTVDNIDWPKTKSTTSQKEELIQILDYLKAAKINAVIFQVRPACDAMYVSKYEPWSYWLTGKQGTAPSPFYDPLKFIIEEAHKRGMELHAWFNPYRIDKKYGFSYADNNPAVKHPEWVLEVGGNKILDPGLPDVREYLTKIIMDVIENYNVDGIHFDDYFYLQGIKSEDDRTFKNYSRGFKYKGNWRRDNVHELVRNVHSKIKKIKPYIKFGISPFGIWRPSVAFPGGQITGWDVYSAIYCDAVNWLKEKTIDYLTPQLYWAFGGKQDYGLLSDWWAKQINGLHLYPGLAFYRVGTNKFDKTQFGKMITHNRKNSLIKGEVFFTAHNFKDNPAGNTDTLKNNYYRYYSLVPQMEWKDNVAPNAPTQLRIDKAPNVGTTAMVWDAPKDKDIKFYVIYSSKDASINFDDPKNIVDLTSNNYYLLNKNIFNEERYFAIRTLDINNNESTESNSIKFKHSSIPPEVPKPLFPSIAGRVFSDTVFLKWNYALNAYSYLLEVSTEEKFTSIFTKQILQDTSFALTKTKGETKYYWRVKAYNNAGESQYSGTYNFVTAFPAAPKLLLPKDLAINIPLETEFKWNFHSKGAKYKFELYEGLSINPSKVIIDTTFIDTTFISKKLKPITIYTWRVKTETQNGFSRWSSVFKFKTEKKVGIEDEKNIASYLLKQNFPNPFNPTTTICYYLPERTYVTLEIFNVLGQQLFTLVKKEENAGEHEVIFDASSLSSGIYFYKIRANNFTSIKKLLLLK